MATRRKAQGPVYQIKVSLLGSRPPIWRRLLVSGDITLAKLHDIIQVAMGWEDAHLHEFIAADFRYGPPSLEPDFFGPPSKDERRAKLSQVLPAPKSKLLYWYDFGDDWRHEILLEKVLPAQDGQTLPACTGGKRACPPEDCGGLWGYDHLLEVLKDPSHEEYEELKEWVGEDIDPEEFDAEVVTMALKSVR